MSAAPSIESHLASLPMASSSDDVGERDRAVAPRVRAYLEEAREYLADLHRSTASGRVVNEANSDLIDRMIRRLFSVAEENVLAEGGELQRGLSVVAVGGYARREMSIFSDVDLLLLYRGELTPYVTSIAERLQYWLWDAGLSVGCATRTIEDTVAIGRKDVTVRTAVLSARFLCADGEFFHDFAEAIRRELLPDVAAFVVEQQQAWVARHERYGESIYLLQPNVKEGAGGLRDYHTAYWVARAVQPSLRGLDDLLHFGLLTELEMNEYGESLDFLWRVRNELHLSSRRANEQMSFELQEQVAEGLGYGKAEAMAEELPVERFMSDYYRAVRSIQNYSQLVIEQCRARTSRSQPSTELREVAEGFGLAEDHLEIPHSAHLRQRPARLLRVFEVAQEYDVPLSRMALRLVHENLDLVTDEMRRDDECRAIFLRILGGKNRVMRTLMAMNEMGLLAAFLPEWEHIVCRWQQVIYHTYTVDVHSIFLVEELRRLWRGKYQKHMPELTELVRSVDDPQVLFLGCLLHDIGKGFGGNHSKRGAVLALDCVERLGLEPERAKRVIFLVEQHLQMSHLAQRRDLSDAKMIYEFAQLCGDRTNLKNLYLCTFADIRASSRDAWTDWRGQLLHELFERTAEFLETGGDDRERAMELIEARVEVRREGARVELQELGMGEDKIEAFFDSMPRRYFISHTPRQIARHARVVLAFNGEQPFKTSYREMRGDFTEFLICTLDVPALYAKVAGTLTARGLNILGSHVYTLRSGLALEVYRLSTPPGGREERDLEWDEFENALRAVLTEKSSVDDLMARRRPPVGKVKPPSRLPPRVSVSNTESDFYTIVDVAANDRIGLLYDLTATIARHGIEVYISKAGSILDQVTDTFYLKDEHGKKLTSEVAERLRVDLDEVTVQAPAEERNG